jgi:serine/threonine protein kinase
MPTEQAAGRPVFASDLYCLGLTAIYTLTGKRPQELTDLRTGDIAWREEAKDVSADFAAILDKATNPNFRERFPTAREMLDALINTATDTLSHPNTEQAESKPAERKGSSRANQNASSGSPIIANSNMPQVATQWFRDFLSPVINVVGVIKKEFNQGRFELSAEPTMPYSQTFLYRIDFTKRGSWEELLSSDVGEYFLSYYPSIENILDSFGVLTENFDTSAKELYKSIEESPMFLKQLLDTYERLIAGERIPRSRFEKSTLPEIAQLVLGQLRLQMSHDPEASKDNLVRFTAYSLLNLEVNFPIHALPDDHVLTNLCRDFANELKGNDEAVSQAVVVAKSLFEDVKGESGTLWQQLRKERLEIARQYNATFE